MSCILWMHTWEPWNVIDRQPLFERSINDPKGESRVVGRILYQERKCILCGKHQIRKDVAK